MKTKQNPKIFLFILLVCIIFIPIFSAPTLAEGNSDFVVENNVLVKYNGKDKNVNIPANLGIQTIGKEVFFENKNIVSVTIPKGVTEIGDRAFSQCDNLVYVNIPESVTKIGDSSFSFSGLTKMQLPPSLTEIGSGAFAGCYELESINIPKGIKKIESSMFYYCKKLKRLELPYGLTNIEDESIQDCHTLDIVRIPDTVKSIGKMTFYGTSRARIEGIKGSYAEEFAKNAYNYHYTGGESSDPVKGIPFIPQTFAPTNTSVMVNGKQVSFTVYNINDNNYFKLRDVAQVLNGTGKQFSVEWNGNKIDLISNKGYKSIGNELSADKPTAKQMASIPKMSVNLDGKSVDVKVYNLGGNNYFQIRDLGQVLNFTVHWNGNSMEIDTTQNYSN